jgi:hypothetical protein
MFSTMTSSNITHLISVAILVQTDVCNRATCVPIVIMATEPVNADIGSLAIPHPDPPYDERTSLGLADGLACYYPDCKYVASSPYAWAKLMGHVRHAHGRQRSTMDGTYFHKMAMSEQHEQAMEKHRIAWLVQNCASASTTRVGVKRTRDVDVQSNATSEASCVGDAPHRHVVTIPDDADIRELDDSQC